MTCLICRQPGIFGGLTSIHFQRGELRLVVNNVPARVCPNCGEAYVEEEVTMQLLQSVEKIYKAGLPEEVIEYERLYVK